VRAEEGDPLGPIVREALRQSRTDCPNAELLAAYVDSKLDKSAGMEIQRHLASCARCRETVLLMSRAADAEASGGTRLQPRASGLQPRASGLQPRLPYLKWLGGAAAAGLAVALWALVAPREDLTPLNKAEDKSAQAQVETPPKSTAEPPPIPKAVEPRSARGAPAAKEAEAEPRRKRDDRAALLREQAAAQRLRSSQPPAASATAESPAPAAPTEEKSADARLDQVRRQRRENSQAFRVGAAEGSLAAEAPGGVRWRIGPAGSIQRSGDGGATWLDEAVKAPGARALAAPTPDVCWVVGDDGLVLRYQAGVWQRVKPPAAAAIVAVTAVDALRATVTLADGRSLTTGDGGATWR
jgi:Putative zinc-finger